jgi:fucose permease
MTKKQNYILIGLIFITMAFMAVNDNVRGIIIPTLKKDFSVSDGSMGIMLFVAYFAYMTFTYIGGVGLQKYSYKFILGLGIVLNILGFGMIYFSPNFYMFLVGLFVSNSGVGFMAIVINTVVPRINVGFQAILMNMIHFCFGLGATLTHRVTGYLISSGLPWRNLYMAIGVVYSVLLLYTLLIKFPEVKKLSSKKSKVGKGSRKLLIFYMIALGMYVSAGVHTSNWFVNYLKEVYSINENNASVYTSIFFAVFAVGRLLGGIVAEKFGYVRTVLVSISLAFVLYLSGIIIGLKGMMMVSISGLFFSIVFPTLVLSINRFFMNPVYITGLVMTAATGISMVIGLVIGFLNDTIGVYLSFYTIPVCLVISVCFTALIYREVRALELLE